jgi:hypothetical protein
MRDVYLHVDSRLRDNPLQTHSGNYKIRLKNMMHGVRSVALTALELPNTFPTFNSDNNVIEMSVYWPKTVGASYPVLPPNDSLYYERRIYFTFQTDIPYSISDILALLNTKYQTETATYDNPLVSDLFFKNFGMHIVAGSSNNLPGNKTLFICWHTTSIILGVKSMTRVDDFGEVVPFPYSFMSGPWVSDIGTDLTLNSRIAFLVISTKPDDMHTSYISVPAPADDGYTPSQKLYPNVNFAAFARIPITEGTYDVVNYMTPLPGQEMFKWEARTSQGLSISELGFTWYTTDGNIPNLVDATHTMLLRFTLDA